MTHLSDREFQARLEALEHGEPLPDDLPPEDAAGLALAGRLLALRAQPSPRLAARVAGMPAVASPAQKVSRFSCFNLVTRWKRRIPMSTPRMALWKRVALGVAALILAFTVTMVAFPNARATVLDLVRKVGGVHFIQIERFEDRSEIEQEGWRATIFFRHLPEDLTILPTQEVSLAEAEATLGFTFTVPTWAPEGFILQDEVSYWLPTEVTSYTTAMLTWEHPDLGPIQLGVLQGEGDEYMLVGQHSVEEVQVRGRPAAVVRGGWDYETGEYQDNGWLKLTWEEHGVVYSLAGSEPAVSVDDLVRMAESMD